MTRDELLIVRTHAPGATPLKDGRVLRGLITAYDPDAPGGPTVEITPINGASVTIRVEDIDAE